jgi:phosphohistidine phosphatase
MLLYLVRHAIAYQRDPQQWPDDRDRPLTAAGEKRFRQAARGLREFVSGVDLVLSSRLARAWQTAALLERVAGWPPPVPCAALEPGHLPHEVLAALQPHAGLGAAALVGHEPGMGELASYLLTGEPGHVAVEMKKGAVECLQMGAGLQPGSAVLRWLAPPKLLRAAVCG